MIFEAHLTSESFWGAHSSWRICFSIGTKCEIAEMITISRSIRTERGMKMSVYASIGITGGAGLGLAYTPIVRGRSEADRECFFLG